MAQQAIQKIAPELRWVTDGGTVLQKCLHEHDITAMLVTGGAA